MSHQPRHNWHVPTVKLQSRLVSAHSFQTDQACVYATLLWSLALSAWLFSQAPSQRTKHFATQRSIIYGPLSLRISDTARAHGAVIRRMSDLVKRLSRSLYLLGPRTNAAARRDWQQSGSRQCRKQGLERGLCRCVAEHAKRQQPASNMKLIDQAIDSSKLITRTDIMGQCLGLKVFQIA